MTGENNMGKNIDLSVIITASNRGSNSDAESLFYTYKRSLEESGIKYEFIYVTDDNSESLLGKLQKLQQKGECIKIVKLAKWFGDASALNIGFEEASGDLILTLPAFQQINENEITKLILSFSDIDMVIAKRTRQKDNIFQRVQARIFHSIVNIILGMHYQDLGCRVRLFKREVLEHIYLYGDQIRFLPLLANNYGFRVKEMDVEQFQSDAVHTVYSLRHYTERIVDLVSIFFLIKFTKKPLRFFGLPGFLIFGVGSLLALYLFYQRMFLDIGLADKPMVLVSILLIVFGIQLFAIGLVAEIIIFTHSKDSKEYIVEKVIGGKLEEFEKVHIPKIEEEV
jgi:glycosyltransferase involved in cell wall biosynthesis